MCRLGAALTQRQLTAAAPKRLRVSTTRRDLRCLDQFAVQCETGIKADAAAGHLAMSRQLTDANIVSAPKQRNTRAENQAIKKVASRKGRQEHPARLRQKDLDASWIVKTTRPSRARQPPVGDWHP